MTDVTGVAIPRIDVKTLKNREIPTPVCALARNDMVFRYAAKPPGVVTPGVSLSKNREIIGIIVGALTEHPAEIRMYLPVVSANS